MEQLAPVLNPREGPPEWFRENVVAGGGYVGKGSIDGITTEAVGGETLVLRLLLDLNGIPEARLQTSTDVLSLSDQIFDGRLRQYRTRGRRCTFRCPLRKMTKSRRQKPALEVKALEGRRWLNDKIVFVSAQGSGRCSTVFPSSSSVADLCLVLFLESRKAGKPPPKLV